MGTLLTGATVVELEPATVEIADLRIDGGRIVDRAARLAPKPGEESLDLTGKLVLPGLVCAHGHLWAGLGRGLPRQAGTQTFEEALAAGRWRLERALDLDAVHAAAASAALDALSAGVTTVVDHHASPSAIPGSLIRVARGLNEVGLRGVLSYEVSDRHGEPVRELALEENVAFAKKAQGRFRGLVGADASFGLSDKSLVRLREAMEASGTGLHLHLAEDPTDERLSVERYGAAPVARLTDANLLGPSTLVAHAVHLSWPELAQVIATGAWLVHTPRSNMELQVGYAPAGRFGSRAALGTDGLESDVLAEAQVAALRSREAGAPIDALHFLANGHRIASQLFGLPLGPLREGAAADLVVLDHHAATPLTPQTLEAQLLFALRGRRVEAVMVDGVWRLWGGKALSVDAAQVGQAAREAADAVWRRLGELA